MMSIHFEGIAADAFQADLLMPNHRFEAHRLLTFGASSYYTAGKLRNRRRLPWRPQTLLIDFDSQFVRHSTNTTGYANPLGLDGVVVSVHLLKNRRDKRKIQALQAKLRLQIMTRLARGLARYFPKIWRQTHAFFRRLLTAYTAQKLPLDGLIPRILAKLPTGKPALAALIARCQALVAAWRKKIDQLMTLAYLIINSRRVANSSYSGEKRRLLQANLHPIAADPHQAANLDYLQAQFNQLLAIEALFKQHQVTFDDLAAYGRRWQLADRYRYTQLGVLD